MPRRVKKLPGRGDYRRGPGQTRVSPKHQVTIPRDAFEGAGLQPGDTLRVEAAGPGRVVLTRRDGLLDQFSGALNTDGELRETVERLRDEWA